MRILFISYELPPLGGGGGRAALEIARRLAARGHGVRILSSLFPGLPERESDAGVEIVRFPVRRKRMDACRPMELLSFMRRSLSAASRAAEEFRPEIVCAFFGIPGGPAAWWLRRRKGLPYVLALRGSDVPRPELAAHQGLHRFTRPFLRRIYRAAGAIVAVSEALRHAALAVEPRVEVQVVPNGIDLAWFNPEPVRPLSGQEVELLFVGRLQEFKGVQHAISALPSIEQRLGRPVRLVVAGDGPYRGELERMAGQLPQGRVRFAGWVAEKDLRALYRSGALLVLPSLVEGHPNAILQAMAMGLPSIGTDAPGIRETIEAGGDGLLFAPNDPASLAEAAVRVLSDAALYESMSRRARIRAAEFTWDRVADRYERILLDAAGDVGQAPSPAESPQPRAAAPHDDLPGAAR